ncbi:myoneurin-like isoform X3 [Bombyx mandarina]|uniref:Myoneurin-like isoform X3 n=1 Tax=Bombyx mandarina TaxID=7092 RepID=A0A6J2K209_BOMMA|nr:myoneurin-like isoform X3 [Bombyx mandarina]
MIEEYDENLPNKIQLLSIEKSCRICITSSYEMSNIFNEKHPEILEKIEFCTGILLKPEDGLPAHICGMCSKNLTVAFDFKTKCIFSDKILRKLCTAVKEEHNCTSEIDYEDDNNDFFTNNNETKSKSSKDCEVDVTIVKTECMDAQNDFKKINLKAFKCKTVRRKKKNKSILRNREVIKKKKVVEEPAEALEPEPPIEFPCGICDLNFDNKKSLVAHRKEKHSSKDGLICEICGKLFPRASYSTHLRTHRTPNYKCDHCDYGTVYKSDLVKHVQRHCGMMFATPKRTSAIPARARTTRARVCTPTGGSCTRARGASPAPTARRDSTIGANCRGTSTRTSASSDTNARYVIRVTRGVAIGRGIC